MKRNMKKIFIIFIIFLIFAAISLDYLLTSARKEIKKATNKIEAKLGKKVVFEKDTLKITDYSLIHQSYSLSNGRTISLALADSLQVK